MERSSVLPIPREATGGMVSAPTQVTDELVAAPSNVYSQPGMVHRFDPEPRVPPARGCRALAAVGGKADEGNPLMIEFLTRC
jgi:hypothetical protein